MGTALPWRPPLRFRPDVLVMMRAGGAGGTQSHARCAFLSWLAILKPNAAQAKLRLG